MPNDPLPPPVVDAVAGVAPDPTASALNVLGAVVGGLMAAVQKAAAELAELKKDLENRPTIDSSATDDEAAATAGDMPEE